MGLSVIISERIPSCCKGNIWLYTEFGLSFILFSFRCIVMKGRIWSFVFNFLCYENNFAGCYIKCHVTNESEISTSFITLFYHCYTLFIQVLEPVIVRKLEGNQEFLSVRLFNVMFLPSRHLNEGCFKVTFLTFLATRACFQYIAIS
jgi:hypothetical protein